jgi:hypothetical protein
LLAKFEKIKALNLDLQEKYDKCFAVFTKELDEVRKIYTRDKAEPPIPRNLPPISVRSGSVSTFEYICVNFRFAGLASCSCALSAQCRSSRSECQNFSAPPTHARLSRTTTRLDRFSSNTS